MKKAQVILTLERHPHRFEWGELMTPEDMPLAMFNSFSEYRHNLTIDKVLADGWSLISVSHNGDVELLYFAKVVEYEPDRPL